MATARKRSASDPHLLCQTTENPPTSAPPARHHRRSVDRVWPPALEVQIARLSMDEGSSHSAHIIPVPPTLQTHPEEQLEDVLTDDGLYPEGDHTQDHAERIVAAAFYTSNSERQGQDTTAGGAAASNPKSIKERRRGSIMGPLSPSTHLQLDHNPHIDIRYTKRGKPYSGNNNSSRRHLTTTLQRQHEGEHSSGGSSGNNSNNNSSGGGGHDRSVSIGHSHPDQSHAFSPASVPLARKFSTGAVVYSESPMVMETNEFGDDLFGKQHTIDLSSSVTSIKSPYITEWIESSATMPHVESPLGEVPILHELPYERFHPHRRPEYRGEGALHTEEEELRHLQEYKWTTVSSTNQILDSPLVASPMKREKNPLSPASSRSISPVGLSPNRSPRRGRSSSPLSRSRSPLQELSRNNLNLNDNSNSNSLYGHVALGLRIRSPLAPPEYRNETTSSSPLLSPMTLDLGDEQDPWKLPTLSALASSSPARIRARSPLAFRPLHSRQHSMTSSSKASISSLSSRRHVWPPTFEPNEIEVEVPSIEARDEIPLQEIWRMEDEERKDRLAAEIGAGGGAGERHAHAEARLIQNAIVQADRASS
ncbi:hypothetical protein BGZ83_005473 [Gryganskiella cystojenkinii]|nr:hypothetical protein BGZ83_005473 [Gryganskiella cystojenkinii]